MTKNELLHAFRDGRRLAMNGGVFAIHRRDLQDYIGTVSLSRE
jgi:hypothetical protein